MEQRIAVAVELKSRTAWRIEAYAIRAGVALSELIERACDAWMEQADKTEAEGVKEILIPGRSHEN